MQSYPTLVLGIYHTYKGGLNYSLMVVVFRRKNVSLLFVFAGISNKA